MFRRVALGSALLALVLALGACKKSSSGNNGGGTGGAGGGAGSGDACMTITTDPTLMGNACNNVHDKCYFNKNNAMIRALGGMCATGHLLGPSKKSCLLYANTPTSPDAVACFLDCVKPQLMMALGDLPSDACLLCPDAVVTCSAKPCLAKCAADSLAPECTACLCAQQPDLLGPGKPGNCLQDAFAQCAGFRPTDEQVGCGAFAPPVGTGGTGAAGTMSTAGTGAAGTMSTAGTGAAGTGAAGTMSSAGTGAAGTMSMAGTGAAGTGAAGTMGTGGTGAAGTAGK